MYPEIYSIVVSAVMLFLWAIWSKSNAFNFFFKTIFFVLAMWGTFNWLKHYQWI